MDIFERLSFIPNIESLGYIMRSDILSALIKKTKLVITRSYSPFSKFPVGACIMADNKCYYTGCNVENASFSLTICAESAALVKMISHGGKKISFISIMSENEDICPPCGACRQRILEFSTPDTKVILLDKNGTPKKIFTIEELLPISFSLSATNG